METLGFAEREVAVVTIVRYELAKALMPVMRDRYPNLTRFIAVDTDEDKLIVAHREDKRPNSIREDSRWPPESE